MTELDLVQEEDEPEHNVDYSWAKDDTDTMLRSFIFQTLVTPGDDGERYIPILQAYFAWIRDGKVPMKLKVV